VDLPPVTAVSDAITVSKALDGIIVVVRSGVAQRKALAETMRQLKMVGVRILGFVYREDMQTHRAYYKHNYNRYDSYRKTDSK
jgi:Mrp family chromosome partitioning ATPase